MRGRLPGSVVDAQVRYSREMAEQTTSSIVVNAEPAAVMAVIGDFDSYPEWAKGVQKAEVVAEGADGWADQVFFVLDVSPIRDEYTLAYEWKGDEQVTWSLVSGKMLRSVMAPRRSLTAWPSTCPSRSSGCSSARARRSSSIPR